MAVLGEKPMAIDRQRPRGRGVGVAEVGDGRDDRCAASRLTLFEDAAGGRVGQRLGPVELDHALRERADGNTVLIAVLLHPINEGELERRLVGRGPRGLLQQGEELLPERQGVGQRELQ